MRSSVELTFDDLHKAYGSTRALDGMSFTALPGRVTGFLGPNGAGKTTTLRILVGLVRADRGRALVGGRPYDELDRPAATVGVSLEGAGFHPRRSGRSHLLLQARAVGVGRSRVEEVLEQVGLASDARRGVGGYSLGMRQRLALAHAILARPDVLVLDEPSNGLDPAGVRWMRDVLAAEARQGAVVLVSSHMLAEMENIADDVVIVSGGRVLMTGSVEELRSRATSCVVVTSPQPDDVLAALAAEGLVARAQGEDVEVPSAAVGDVVRAIGARAVAVSDVRSRVESLETVYFDVLARAGVGGPGGVS